jgi:hypothetical protein
MTMSGEEYGSDARLGADGVTQEWARVADELEAERLEDVRTADTPPADDGLPDAPVD